MMLMMMLTRMAGTVKVQDHVMGAQTCFLLLVLLSFIRSGACLSCYACADAATNEQCNVESNIVDCVAESTATTKYDTCQTKLTKTVDYGVRITKRCVVGPCSLGGTQDVALGLSCDRKDKEFDCEYCCSTDKCNVSSATSLKVSLATHAITAGYVMLCLASIVLSAAL